jgi:hypothetical protein
MLAKREVRRRRNHRDIVEDLPALAQFVETAQDLKRWGVWGRKLANTTAYFASTRGISLGSFDFDLARCPPGLYSPAGVNPYQDDVYKTRTNPWHNPSTFAGSMERMGQQDRERQRFESSLSSPYSVRLPGDRSKNDVANCALLVAVGVTWAIKRLFGLEWEMNWKALAITAIVTIIIGKIYFERHLSLARGIIKTFALAVVAVIVYGVWSLSRHWHKAVIAGAYGSTARWACIGLEFVVCHQILTARRDFYVVASQDSPTPSRVKNHNSTA